MVVDLFLLPPMREILLTPLEKVPSSGLKV